MINENNNPVAIDFNDLLYYDKKIKEYINEKEASIISIIPDSYSKEETYNKKEINDKLNVLSNGIKEVKAEIDKHSIELVNLKDHNDENEAAILVLQEDDKLINERIAHLATILVTKADETTLDNYVTKELLNHYSEDFYKTVSKVETDLNEVGELVKENHLAIDSINVELENKADEKHKHHVADIIDFSLEGYATEKYVDDKINQIVHPSTDHLATKAELLEVSNRIPTKVSQLQNDNEYITKQELDSKGYLTEHQSLDNYATKEFVSDSISKINIPDTSNFITMEQVEAKNYLSEIPANYVTEEELNSAISSIPPVDLSDYVTEEEFQRVSDQSAANNKLILDIGSELVRIDDTLETIPTNTSQLTNDSGFITSIPSEYITESELDAKGYITDVSNFATHEEVQEAVSALMEEEIETTIKNNIQDEVATQLAQNETIQYGTFGEI